VKAGDRHRARIAYQAELPQPLLTAYADCVVGAIDAAELDRAFRAVVTRLLAEVDAVDPDLHERVAKTLMSLSVSR
jgi:hypothetical protein